MFEVIPGILEKDWAEIERKLEICRSITKSVHIDLIDGKFAANTTFLDPSPFAKYSKDFLLELHMMVEDPIKYLKPFSDAGFARFVGHIEKMPDQEEFVAQAQLLGEVGLGIDAETPIEAIKAPLDDLDGILVMTVKAGFSGQSFIEQNLEKVKELVARTTIPIEIDGGVDAAAVKMGCASGVRRFVATSFLFGGESVQKQYQLLIESTESFKPSGD